MVLHFRPFLDSRRLGRRQRAQRRPCLVQQAPRFRLLFLQSLDNVRRRLRQKTLVAKLAFR